MGALRRSRSWATGSVELLLLLDQGILDLHAHLLFLFLPFSLLALALFLLVLLTATSLDLRFHLLRELSVAHRSGCALEQRKD